MSFLGSLTGINSTATFRHFAIGTFTLDVVTEEQFQKTWTKSESAVETGARISDHRIINPHEIMIRGTVVNYEPAEIFADQFPAVAGLLDTIPLPISVSAVTDQVRAAVNKYSGINRSPVMSFMPNLINDSSATDDRITRIKNTLEQIASGEGLIEVLTSTGVYQNVQIGGVSVTRNRLGDAEFSIFISEILTYDVQIISGIDVKIKPQQAKKEEKKPTGEKKSERPATQSTKLQNKGKTTPQKSKKSALKTMVDSSKGFL